jgi:cytochrome b
VYRKILELIATAIECCQGRRPSKRGHPPASLVRVLAALRGFLREGTPWRSLRATTDKISGSTLRRCLARWSRTGLLGRVHALLIRICAATLT